jgi:phage portal protein BeeE
MRIFGLTIGLASKEKTLSSVGAVGSRGWWPLIREAAPGNWQRNKDESLESVLQYAPAFSCITLISSDISK